MSTKEYIAMVNKLEHTLEEFQENEKDASDCGESFQKFWQGAILGIEVALWIVKNGE